MIGGRFAPESRAPRIFLSFVNKADVFCDKADRFIFP
jgi:hypothetical protein